MRYCSRPVARFVPFLVVLTLCMGSLGCGQARSESARPTKADQPTLVATVLAEGGALEDSWTYVGETRALMAAELGAGVAGEVREVNARVGDRVAAGQRLVRVDERLARAQMRAARANRAVSDEELAQAQRDLERAERLGETILPEAELEQTQTRTQTLNSRTESLRAAVAQSKERLRLHRVDAPFDGTISARHVDPGDWVQPGDPVLEIVAEDRVEVIVSAAPELSPHVDSGTAVTLRHERGTVEGKVLGVVRALDPVTRTITVRVVPDAPAPWLLVGASVDVDFAVVRRGEGVIVPRDAVVAGAVNTRVIEVVDGAAQPVVVEVLATAGDRALVTGDGLAVGDTVVVRGNERLRPGERVTVGEGS